MIGCDCTIGFLIRFHNVSSGCHVKSMNCCLINQGFLLTVVFFPTVAFNPSFSTVVWKALLVVALAVAHCVPERTHLLRAGIMEPMLIAHFYALAIDYFMQPVVLGQCRHQSILSRGAKS